MPWIKIKLEKKVELIERVRLSNGIVKIDPKIDGGKWHEYKRSGSVAKDSERDVTCARELKSFLPQACNHRFARSVFRFCLFISQAVIPSDNTRFDKMVEYCSSWQFVGIS